VVFKNITVNNSGYQLHKDLEFLGYDADHAIKNVLIENVVINGRKLTQEDIKVNPPIGSKEGIMMNEFVYDVTVR
jgi:hypothetical protein